MQALMAVEEDAAHGTANIIPVSSDGGKGEIFFRGLNVSLSAMHFVHREVIRVKGRRLSHGKSGGKRRSSFFVCQ